MSRNIEIPCLGFGLGLRSQHIADIIEARPALDWFEILSENFIGKSGLALKALESIRKDYKLVAHGVSLNIAGIDPLDKDYLKKLKALADQLEVSLVSDHLCWTGVEGINTHDLMPVPYTKEALKQVVSRIEKVQDILKRPLTLENPSTYIEFPESDIPEPEFMAKMAEQSGCLLLLDVNNIHVSCFNHNWDSDAYLAAIPKDKVAYMHLAGYSHQGTHIIDTHDAPVSDEVWTLYAKAVQRFVPNTLVEWDDKIPPLTCLMAELEKAKAIADEKRIRSAS